MEWYLKVLQNYVGFAGRARRKEYWYFVLFNVLISLALTAVDAVLQTGVLAGLYSLAVFLPSLAVSVRRLHDTDRSGWWLLVGLIPVVGVVVLLVFTLTDSTMGDNRYGPSPKYVVGMPPAAIA
ncbi:MAG TPA: DUF805 domain-containing protein [Euzebyales bacterium]|nr:DUF805 domain-containing protein [Euzebyales bacterium]